MVTYPYVNIYGGFKSTWHFQQRNVCENADDDRSASYTKVIHRLR